MWKFMGAQEAGTSHKKIGLPCQDRLACLTFNNGVLIAAISDGAGSAAFAEVGAEIAVNAVVQQVADGVRQGRDDYLPMLSEAALKAREEILEIAAKRAASPRDFAATLLAVALHPSGGAALQIGDGVIVARQSESGWNWVFWPQRGEYANTTYFLTDENAADLAELKEFTKPVTDIALLSDGLESLALHYATQTAHEPFFNGMIEPLLGAEGCDEIKPLSAQLKAFLGSDRIGSRTDDDVSLLLATCCIQSPP